MAQPRQAQPRHSKQAWEDRRALIKQLYIDEDMPLPELIRTMAQLHSFPATERMYKRKFEDWGLRKYNTKDTARAIVNEKVRRQAAGKRSCFTRNGKIIKLESYLKRKGITEYHVMDFDDPANTVTLPDGIRCCTPDPQSSLEPPALQHFHESFLRSLENLCSMIDTMNYNDLLRSSDCSAIIMNMYHASRLMANGEAILGGRLMRAAFASIDRYIAEADAPSTLQLLSCIGADDWADPGSTLIFWKYLNARLEGSQHAWRNMVKPVYGWLHDFGRASFKAIQDQSSRMLIERHSATFQILRDLYCLGPLDYRTIRGSTPSTLEGYWDRWMLTRNYICLQDLVCQNSQKTNTELIADRVSSDNRMYLSFAELLYEQGDLLTSAQERRNMILQVWLDLKYLLPAFEPMQVNCTKCRVEDGLFDMVADHLNQMCGQLDRLQVGTSAERTTWPKLRAEDLPTCATYSTAQKQS